MQQLRRKDEKFMEIWNWTANFFSCFWASYFALFEKQEGSKQIIKVYESWEFFSEFMKAEEEYNFGMHDIQ